MRNLILFGFKGSGKTTVGQLLAQTIGWQFIDTDHLISEKHGPCRELYRAVGESAFRAIERELIGSLCIDKSSVIALGGGAVLCPETLCHLQKIGSLIYLKVDKAILKERILADGTPAFMTSFESHYQDRSQRYEEIDAYVVETSTRCPSDIVQELIGIAYGKQ